MKKMVLFQFICVLVFFFNNKNLANHIVVCPSCKTTSLKDAVSIATDYDTIDMKAGVYHEFELEITKPLVILAEENTWIDGDKKGEIIRVLSDHVTIDGLSIRNVGMSYTQDFSAVRVVKSKHFVLRNLYLETLFFGIYLEKSSHGKVYGNTIRGNAQSEHNSGNGIHLWYSNYVEVYDNDISKMRDGIYFEFVDHSEIYNNLSTDNLRYGLHFMFSNDDSYNNNTFRRNGAGVAVMFSKRIKMIKNLFENNWGTASYGLLLKEINDATISENVFRKNTIGINIEGTNRITYENNDFENNGWALKVRGACYGNHFYRNNFMSNSFDVSYNSKMNDNIFSENYWSEYSGYDLDKDGIGDVPFRPVNLFSYVVNRTPESIVLLRSLFIHLINFSEKVSPVFTPDKLIDSKPRMKRII